MIAQDLIDKAKLDQSEYWESLWKNFTFFKKTEVDPSIFTLANWPQYQTYQLKYLHSSMLGYPWLAKYWATSFLDYHVFYMWNMDNFAGLHVENLDVKKAGVRADKMKVDRLKYLKEMYP